jgi:hypothetical protein
MVHGRLGVSLRRQDHTPHAPQRNMCDKTGCDIGCTCHQGGTGWPTQYALPCSSLQHLSCHLSSQGGNAVPLRVCSLTF